MICYKCGKEMEVGEVASARGDFIYWEPKNLREWNKMRYLKAIVKKRGGIVLGGRTHNLSEPLHGWHCENCKTVLIEY